MNPALIRAEIAFRAALDGSPFSSLDRIYTESILDCPLLEQHTRFTAEFSFTAPITWRVPYLEQQRLGWPEPSFDEFVELYERVTFQALRPGPLILAPQRTPLSRCRPGDFSREILLPQASWLGLYQRVELAEYAESMVHTFRGIPIRTIDEIEAPRAPIDILPGQVSYVHENMTAAEISERYGRSPLLADLDENRAFLEGWSQRVLSTMFYVEQQSGTAEERQAADARAEALLRSWLTPDQLKDLDAHGYFHVIGNETGKRYRILRGRQMNVIELGDGDRPVVGRCFLPAGRLAQGDIMLGQKISLETRERKALAKSNMFDVARPNLAGVFEEYNGLGFVGYAAAAGSAGRPDRMVGFDPTGVAAAQIAAHQAMVAASADAAARASALGQLGLVALALIALGQLVLVAHALIWAAGFVFSMWAAGH